MDPTLVGSFLLVGDCVGDLLHRGELLFGAGEVVEECGVVVEAKFIGAGFVLGYPVDELIELFFLAALRVLAAEGLVASAAVLDAGVDARVEEVE